MTDLSSSLPAAETKAAKVEKADAATLPKKGKKPPKPKRALFVENIKVDIVDEVAERKRMKRVFRVVQMQALIIVAMAGFLITASPFFQTVYFYYSMDPSDANRHTTKLLALTAPNLTNQAVTSWATNSITEIMTFGFGDYLAHLRAQKKRFTPEGWTSFVGAFDKMKLGQVFRERQLVLTTVASDTAIIVRQGPSANLRSYEWELRMPVIMTYATNDNITHHDRAVIDLTLTRVPPIDNPNGLAIKTWTVG